MQYTILAIAVLLLVSYIILIIYYRNAWQSIPLFKSGSDDQHFSTSIAVIIPARNESANIKACLDSVTAQTYPSHLTEVLVIDDHSTDNTAQIVSGFNSNGVKLISLKDHVDEGLINSHKKKAIETGILQSSGKLIVTTDADCIVLPQWLESIAALYEKHNPALIAAPVAIDCSNSFIEIFEALDFMTLQGITGASVYRKMHSMCNGANLAYERTAFNEVEGFKGIDDIASGDDMLLMHKIYKRYPQRVMFLKSKEAIVKTRPQKTMSNFINQRIRWASKADKYDDKRIFSVLLLVYLFNVILLVLPFVNISCGCKIAIGHWNFTMIECWLLILFLKTITELYFLYPVAGFFNKRSLLWLFPLMQPFHIIYTIVAGWLGKFGSYNWKDRKVK